MEESDYKIYKLLIIDIFALIVFHITHKNTNIFMVAKLHSSQITSKLDGTYHSGHLHFGL